MAEDDVVDIVLAAATYFEVFGSDTDTDEDNAKERHAPRQRRQR